MMSQSDPDAALVRQGSGDSRPRYKNHRVIDDAKGVITGTQTTPGSIAENKKLMDLLDQHENNTRCQSQIVVADHKYGTSENYIACQERGITTHMGDALGKAQHARQRSVFGDEAFIYDAGRDIYFVQLAKRFGHAACMPFVAHSNTKRPPEFVVLALYARNARALTMGARCKGMKNKRPWM
jgi:hypothetical protein